MSFCGKMTVSLDLPTLMLEIKENYVYTFGYFIYISLLNIQTFANELSFFLTFNLKMWAKVLFVNNVITAAFCFLFYL
jgi:hypothetical protein